MFVFFFQVQSYIRRYNAKKKVECRKEELIRLEKERVLKAKLLKKKKQDEFVSRLHSTPKTNGTKMEKKTEKGSSGSESNYTFNSRKVPKQKKENSSDKDKSYLKTINYLERNKIVQKEQLQTKSNYSSNKITNMDKRTKTHNVFKDRNKSKREKLSHHLFEVEDMSDSTSDEDIVDNKYFDRSLRKLLNAIHRTKYKLKLRNIDERMDDFTMKEAYDIDYIYSHESKLYDGNISRNIISNDSDIVYSMNRNSDNNNNGNYSNINFGRHGQMEKQYSHGRYKYDKSDNKEIEDLRSINLGASKSISQLDKILDVDNDNQQYSNNRGYNIVRDWGRLPYHVDDSMDMDVLPDEVYSLKKGAVNSINKLEKLLHNLSVPSEMNESVQKEMIYNIGGSSSRENISPQNKKNVDGFEFENEDGFKSHSDFIINGSIKKIDKLLNKNKHNDDANVAPTIAAQIDAISIGTSPRQMQYETPNSEENYIKNVYTHYSSSPSDDGYFDDFPSYTIY